jgi:hypothetical protein
VTIKFLVDENQPRDLIVAIKRLDRAIDTLHVVDLGGPGMGASDPAILRYCEVEQRMLVTDNRSTMPEHERDHLAAGRHLWGILLMRPDFSVGAYARTIHFIWSESEAAEWQDKSDWIPWQ